MNYDFLGFPSEYEVGKEIREQFLKSTTITAGRKRLISERVTDITILYDLHLKDESEMIIIMVGIDKTVDEYTERSVVIAVASTFPYQSMIILRNGLGAKVFTFEAERQEKNLGRMRIHKMYMSLRFHLEKIDDRAGGLFESFRQSLKMCESAKDLSKEWCKNIDSEWDSYKAEKEAESYSMEKIFETVAEADEWFHSVDKYLNDAEDMREREYPSVECWGEVHPWYEYVRDDYDDEY